MVAQTYTFPALPAFSLSHSAFSTGACPSRANASLFLCETDTRLLAGTHLYELKAGDLFLMPAHTPASVQEGCGQALAFPASVLRTLAPRLLFQAANGGAAFCPSEPLSFCADALASGGALAFFALFDRLSHSQEVTVTRELPLPRPLRQALTYLFEHPSAPLDTDALALRYDISKSTLLRAFRTHLGITPNAYLRLVRDAHAE